MNGNLGVEVGLAFQIPCNHFTKEEYHKIHDRAANAVITESGGSLFFECMVGGTGTYGGVMLSIRDDGFDEELMSRIVHNIVEIGLEDSALLQIIELFLQEAREINNFYSKFSKKRGFNDFVKIIISNDKDSVSLRGFRLYHW